MTTRALSVVHSMVLVLAAGCSDAPAALDAATLDVGRTDTATPFTPGQYQATCYVGESGRIEFRCIDPSTHMAAPEGWVPFCDDARAPASLRPLGTPACYAGTGESPSFSCLPPPDHAADRAYAYCVPP